MSAVKHQVAHKSEPKQSYGDNGNEAAGLWYLNDLFINLDQQTLLNGSAIYEDHSVKTQGEWRILRTGYKRLLEMIGPLHSQWQITSQPVN